MGNKRTYFFREKEELIDSLSDIINKGDTILVKGSRGIAMETIVEKLINE